MEKNPGAWSLGEFLRAEREKRGVTIEQMVSATKISLRLLVALENDQYSDLPAKPFIRGFVVSYCRFLGLSSQEVLTRFSRYLDEKAEERPKRDAGHNGYAFERREGDGGRTGLWILMGSMLLIGGVVIAVFKPALKHHRRSSIEKLQDAHASPTPTGGVVFVAAAPVSAQPTLAATPSPTPSDPASNPSPMPSPSPSSPADALGSAVVAPEPAAQRSRRPDPLFSGKDLLKEEIRVKVVIKALDDVWVKFKVDEKQKNRLILRKGIVLVLFAQKTISLQTSDPSSIVISRSTGEPSRLRLIHGELPMDDILLQKQGVAPDGRTLLITADQQVQGTNPFEGEPVLGPPPARAERPASESSAE